MAARPTGLYDRITGGDSQCDLRIVAVFVLVPLLRKFVEPWLHKYWGWSACLEGPPLGIGMLAAGIILAINGSAIVSAITPKS